MASGGPAAAADDGCAASRPLVLVLGDAVELTYKPPAAGRRVATLELAWEGGPRGDLLADAVVASCMMLEGERGDAEAGGPAAERAAALAKGDLDAARAAETRLTAGLLGAQFGTPEVTDEAAGTFVLACGGDARVGVDVGDQRCWLVSGGDGEGVPGPAAEATLTRVEAALGRLRDALAPVPLGGKVVDVKTGAGAGEPEPTEVKPTVTTAAV